jgi:hypothetical protein
VDRRGRPPRRHGAARRARGRGPHRLGRQAPAVLDEAGEPTALYDWDSVQTDREPRIAGTAAGAFTYTEELAEPVARWPTPDESLAFLADYELARGAPFSADERRDAHAACVYLIAYAARCHHAVGGDPATAMRPQDFADALL